MQEKYDFICADPESNMVARQLVTQEDLRVCLQELVPRDWLNYFRLWWRDVIHSPAVQLSLNESITLWYLPVLTATEQLWDVTSERAGFSNGIWFPGYYSNRQQIAENLEDPINQWVF